MSYIKKREADDFRNQIWASYNNNEDWRTLYKRLNVKKATAYRWIKNQDVILKQRGGARKSIITQDHRIQMELFIEENPKITLKQLNEKLQKKYEINVSTECIRQHLDGLLYTIKDLRNEPEKANCEVNKIKRREYVQRLLEYQAENRPIVYMDETNFNLFISRKKGRSKKGTRCTYVTAGSKGSNIHVIGCIGNMGFTYSEIRRGSFKKPDAQEFVRNCLRKAKNTYASPVVMIIDNAPCHTSMEEVFLESEFSMHKLLRLAPYSPMFNAIEYIWSTLKSKNYN